MTSPKEISEEPNKTVVASGCPSRRSSQSFVSGRALCWQPQRPRLAATSARQERTDIANGIVSMKLVSCRVDQPVGNNENKCNRERAVRTWVQDLLLSAAECARTVGHVAGPFHCVLGAAACMGQRSDTTIQDRRVIHLSLSFWSADNMGRHEGKSVQRTASTINCT